LFRVGFGPAFVGGVLAEGLVLDQASAFSLQRPPRLGNVQLWLLPPGQLAIHDESASFSGPGGIIPCKDPGPPGDQASDTVSVRQLARQCAALTSLC
jgi:hypothetical protein